MIYYTVFDANGNKIADCGDEGDAKWLAECRRGTYKTNRLDWSVTIDVELPRFELPVHQVVPKEYWNSMYPDIPDDIDEPIVKQLSESDLEKFTVN